MTLPIAFAPYVFLAIIAVVVLTVTPVRSLLETFSVGLPFPATDTGFGVREAGSRCLRGVHAAHTSRHLPASFGVIRLPDVQAPRPISARHEHGRRARHAAKDALPVTTSVSALLLMSGVMSHSGEITVLALGLSAVAGSTLYLAFANFIAIVGSLTTSSNTASNVLFGPLQATGAQAEGVSVTLVLGAQAAGAAVGNAISPADALLGATTVGDPSLVGGVLRRAIPWAIVTGLLISLATVALSILAGEGGDDDEAPTPDRCQRADSRVAGAHRDWSGERTAACLGSRSDCRRDRDGYVLGHALGRQRAGLTQRPEHLEHVRTVGRERC